MKVLQLIDSLNPGGAERIAVNLANMLCHHLEASHLCVTRQEGGLKSSLSPEVNYHFLGKRRSVDLKALFRLKRLIKDHKIDVVHAHTTSYFLAAQLKFILKGVKIIWHEHHGARNTYSDSKNRAVIKAARKFDAIITVNPDLKQ